MTPPPTHQEPTPRLPRLPDQGRIRDIYNVVVPVIAVLTLLTAFAALGWSWQNSRADHRQDQEHIADQAAASKQQDHLLKCFDDFATALAGGLPLVREATVTRDNARVAWETAQGNVSKAIENALAHIATAGADGSQLATILAAFTALDKASADLAAANEHLAVVRSQNPYPAAPSVFCDDN